MPEPLKNADLEKEKLATTPVGTAPMPPALPGTPPAYDEEQGRRMEMEAERRGRSLGEAVGGALGSLRAKVRSGLRVVGGKSHRYSEQFDEAADAAREKARELRDDAEVRLDNYRRMARQRFYEARREARRAAHDYPLQTLAVIGGTAFVIGFVLRIWRDNSD